MRRRLCIVILLLSLAQVAAPAARSQATSATDPVDYVDPFIGTLGGGFTFPGPAAPYGMVQLSPDTDGYLAYTGYHYHDQFIRGFSHHHIESMGVKSNGNLPFMPSVGPVVSSDPRSWMSPFDHATEEAEPGYYKVLLKRFGITAELTAGTRVAMHRYTFPPAPQSNVILDVGRSNKEWEPWDPASSAHRSSLEIIDDRTIVGSAESDQGYTIHFAARFDRPFATFGTWGSSGGSPSEGERSAEGRGAGGYVSFDTTSDRDVLVKVGISFVDRANAMTNLDSEKPDWDFDALRAATRSRWRNALSTIEVADAPATDLTSFYTALYHAQLHPNVFSDANGEYMGYDGAVHTVSDREQYANFSLWDTYRGENQLLATIDPQRYREMMLSLLDAFEQMGRFPQWAMNNAYPDYMVGDPIQPTIVDGYCRGVLTSDEAETFYAALRHQAFDPQARAAAQGGYEDYLTKGYLPDRASETMEYALADFSLALMADSLGHHEDRDVLLDRARNYANVIDPASGFARPREADGSWREPYRPEEPDHFVEGTGWQYTWLAPHDLRGLFDLIGSGRGGDPLVRDRLDTFFSSALADAPGAVAELQKSVTLFGVVYAGNQYAPSNEHDLHAPYLYDYAGEPWKTQKILRGYQMLFRPTPDGLPGNDDLGSMSAWYVWSALGFYPVTGGAPVYAIGSPLFERVEIHPVGGETITLDAPGASFASRYIQRARLGNEELERPWIAHDDLLSARSITFDMAAQPNQAWGAEPTLAPPSLASHALEAFGCARIAERRPATLEYVGERRARGDRIHAAAVLSSDGRPIAGGTVVFAAGGVSVAGTTGADGRAAADIVIPDHGRSVQLSASFAGTEDYAPSETTTTVRWGA